MSPGDDALAAFGTLMREGREGREGREAGLGFEEACEAAHREVVGARRRDARSALGHTVEALRPTKSCWRRCWGGQPARPAELAAARLVGLLTEPEVVVDERRIELVA
jgi:hypothetical protein